MMHKLIIKYFKRVALSVCLLSVLGMSALTVDGLNDQVFDADVAVVLGCWAHPDGPSDPLKARLDAALVLYKNKKVKRFFVTGGIDHKGTNEAEIMADYLQKNGVPESLIIKDQYGINTIETARNLKKYMQQEGFSSAIVVSQYFHISRTKLALRSVGITQLGNIHAEYIGLRDIYSVPRDLVGYVVYWFKYAV